MPTISYHSLNGRIRSQIHSDGRKVALLPDALGTVAATMSGNSAGRVFRSAPYGSTLQETGGNVRPRNEWVGGFGYRRTDMRHAEQYVRARHYSSVGGQWTTLDPLWPLERSYSYVSGKPTNHLDPTGLAQCCNIREKLVMKCLYRPSQGKEFWKTINMHAPNPPCCCEGLEKIKLIRLESCESGRDIQMVGDGKFLTLVGRLNCDVITGSFIDPAYVNSFGGGFTGISCNSYTAILVKAVSDEIQKFAKDANTAISCTGHYYKWFAIYTVKPGKVKRP